MAAAAFSASRIVVGCHSEFTARLVSCKKLNLSGVATPATGNSSSSNSSRNPSIGRRRPSRGGRGVAHPPPRFSDLHVASSSSSPSSRRNRSRSGGRPGHMLPSPSPSQQQAIVSERDRLSGVECHASANRLFHHSFGVDSSPRGIDRSVIRTSWRPARTCCSLLADEAAEVDGAAAESSASPPSPAPSSHLPSSSQIHSSSNETDSEDSNAFRDEGAELEVRVGIPGELMPVESNDVRVVAEAGSLYVGIAKPDTEFVCLLEAPCLYGEIKPCDTVWFLDEESIAINLRKVNNQLKWPGLKQNWETLSKGVAKLLKGASVYVIGELTEANACVANDLGPALGYVPLNTQQLVEQVTKMPISELAEDEGDVAEAEKAVLAGLSSHVRCVVSTIGGNEGAAASMDGWNHLHCGITVWVHCGAPDEDEEAGRTIVTRAKMESSLPEAAPGASYGKADVTVAVGLPAGRWESDATRPVAEGVLKAVKQLLERDSELPTKKGLYRRLGCRGDWPHIMPPGWNPDQPEGGEARESQPNELEQLVASFEGDSSSPSTISEVHSEVTELLQASKREKDSAAEEHHGQTTPVRH